MAKGFQDLPGVEPCFFRKGDRLIECGEPLDYIYYLRKGTVYRELMTDKGVESILSCKESGGVTNSLIGILHLYGPSATRISPNNFVAGTDCYCLRIPAEACKAYLRQNPDLLEQLVGTALYEYTYLTNLYLGKSEVPAPSLLCRWMLTRMVKAEDGNYYLKSYNNNEIAKFLNMHKVTVSRIFIALRHEGILEKVSKGHRIVDMARVRAIAINEEQIMYS